MAIDSAQAHEHHSHRVGNAIPGRLAAVLRRDPYVTTTVCAHCEAAHLVSDLYVELQPRRTELRCATCREVQALLTQCGRITCVDLRGMFVV
jgi:Family of unknown function (DUF6510)